MTEDTETTAGSDDPIDRLLDLAFHHGPAMEANRLIHDVRQQYRGQYRRAYNYEVSLLDRTWEQLCQSEPDQLTRYLRAMGLRRRFCAPVFVSLFYGETLYFIRAKQFLEELVRAKGGDDALRADEDALLPVPVERGE